MQTFINHLKQYFNVKVAVRPMHFALLYITVTLIFAGLAILTMTPEDAMPPAEGEVLRFGLGMQLLMLAYEGTLVPLYFKRLLSMGWKKLEKELVVLVMVLPVVLATFLSEGAYMAMLNVIFILRLMSLILTFILFVWPAKNTEEV